jgi:cyclopropane-fatty-acyl-phospholipid synthase
MPASQDVRIMTSMNLEFIGAVTSTFSKVPTQSLPTNRFSLQRKAHDSAPLLNAVFREYKGPAFAIRFWDDSMWYFESEDVGFRICLRSQDAWEALSTVPDDVALGEKYIKGEIDVEGDLFLALRALPLLKNSLEEYIAPSAFSMQEAIKLSFVQLSRLLRGGTVHSERRDADSIAFHYDKLPRFYELFLGPSMVYSCAYFKDWKNSLDQAQFDKLDLICRMLDMKPRDRFMDIGCGWGSLVLHSIEKYGAIGHGISLSREQVEYANKRIAQAHREDWAGIYWSDFRDLSEVHMPFNKLSSVGMCEHVGLKHIDAYFREAYKLLLPGGLFLNHGITRSAHFNTQGPSFIDRYVFPDGELLTLTEMVRAAEDAGFEVRDVEDLREHYEETLHRWVEDLCKKERQAVALTNHETFRTWKLYMAGCAEAFRRDDIAIHQLLLSRNANGKSGASTVRERWNKNG